MSSQKVIVQSGGGFGGLLTLFGIVLVTLKLCGVITWPWIGVLAPIWVPVVLFLAIALITVVIVGLIGIGCAIVEAAKK